MIFLGDIAYPGSFVLINEQIEAIIKNKAVIVNLEGPIINKAEIYREEHILFNSHEVLKQFKCSRKIVANLANNHIMDLGLEGLEETINYLEENKISYLGAGKDKKTAAESRNIMIDDNSVSFLSYGWNVIQCVTSDLEKPGVNPMEKQYVMDSVIQEKKMNPDAKLIVMFHWNYELEKFPQPRHRELAKKLIDMGVDLIIGHHPHIVNGVEIYKGKPIVYSLGNWFIPHNHFWGGRLSYPKDSNLQLAFEWDLAENKYLNHWFKFDPIKNQINYLESKNLDDDNRIEDLTPFSGMNKGTYEKWFRKNRVKNKGLPIYNWDDSNNTIQSKNIWVKLRGRLIQVLIKSGLK